MSNKFKAQVIERRPGHPDEGKVVRETELTPNLILDAGMDRVASTLICNLFTHCAIGTGTTPTQDDSGSVKAQTSGTNCQADGAFFTIGDIGKLLRFDTGEKAKILAFVDDQNVTLDATLNVSVDTFFTMYRVSQTGLTTEVARTANYLTGAGNCGTTRAGSVLTHQRTFDFPAEVSDQAYNEVGFSHSATIAANLNTRGIFSGAPVTVLTGQQLRVIYYFVVTLAPTSPTDAEWAISGWPALEHPVAVDAGTDRISLTAHGFAPGTKIYFEGAAPPNPLVFGTDYYVVNTAADNFQVEASIGGGAIDITSTGTAVILFTNTEGQVQLGGVSMSAVRESDGVTIAFGGTGPLSNEPMTTIKCGVSNSAVALPTWPIAGLTGTDPAIVSGGLKNLTPATYTNGSFTRTWSVTYATTEANSTTIRRVGIGSEFSSTNIPSDGLQYRFDHSQEKSSLFTLTLSFRRTWDRDFV